MDQPDDRPDPTPAQSFAEVLGEAIAAQHLTLDRLQVRLRRAGTPVSSATLSYWQTGRSLPTRRGSMRAVQQLEEILALPPGHLVQALPPEAGDVDHFAPQLDRLLPVNEIVNRLLASMDLDLGRHFTGLLDQTHCVVDPHGVEQGQRTVQLFRSNEAGLRHLPVVLCQDADEPCVPEVEATSGCRLGRVASAPQAQLLVAELLLPRPMARGELHQLGYSVHWAPTATRSFRLERVLVNRHQVFTSTVEFLGEPPRSARRYHLPGTPEDQAEAPRQDEVDGEALPVDDGQVQNIVLQAQPGVHGIAWSW